MDLEVEISWGWLRVGRSRQKSFEGSWWGCPGCRAGIRRPSVHKPCSARAAVTSSARVANWGDSSTLRLPQDDGLLSRWCWGETRLDRPGDRTMVSAPWSTRAVAWSRKICPWLSIYLTRVTWSRCGCGRRDEKRQRLFLVSCLRW